MSWGSCKTVDSNFAIEIGIMDTSKGSVEPVRGFKLPVNVGKGITTEKISILAQKACRLRSGF